MPPASDLEYARYARMRWNTPLSEEHARLLLNRLDIRPGASLLDLGCGWGELLLRAVESAGVTSGIGVDIDAEALARGRSLAADRGLDGRVSFVVGSADAWQHPADRVICVGAAHVWGGAEAALTAAIQIVQPGGRLLFGDGCWERSPNEEAAKLFGDAVLTLRELVECVHRAKWRILHLSTADQREWDDFESTWRAGRQEWLLANPGDERAPTARNELDLQARAVRRDVSRRARLLLPRPRPVADFQRSPIGPPTSSGDHLQVTGRAQPSRNNPRFSAAAVNSSRKRGAAREIRARAR